MTTTERGSAGGPAAPAKLRVSEGPSDAELVLRARAGDRWAEEALFRRHVEAATLTALRLLRHRHDAEDVVQDAFVAAFTELAALREPSAFRAWLMRLTIHKVHRRFRRRKLMRALGLDRSEADAPLDRLAREDASPTARAELAWLERVFLGLATEDRAAWLLRHVEGHALEEVAELAGCSLATAKRRIARAEAAIETHRRASGGDER